jgi:hypothetical protein
MTVSSTTVKNSYSGNGSTTQFAYGYKIFADSDLIVIIRTDSTGAETVKTLTTHYTVAGAGDASGGSITFTSGNTPASGETVVIIREVPQTQAIDYIANDPFPAESHEEGLDRATMTTQQVQEELNRSLKISRTNTMTSTEFTVGATDRANKVLSFDSSGELAVTQELGTFRGNWSASTAYQVRDLVKDTSTNNIFMANTAHTSSGSQPLTSNTDSAKWDLIVDAATATTSSTSAANSATAAANSATASANSATASANSASAASTSETNAASSASTSSTQATNSANSATASANSASAAAATFDLFDDSYLGAKSSNPTVDNDGNALQDGALYFDTTNDVMKVYNLSTTTWLQLTPTVTNQNNINSAVANASNINAAVANASNINAAVSNASNINSAVSNASNINAVAGISTAITNVNNNSSNINSVNSNSTNINLTAGSITNVNNVGGSIASVNTAASNLTSINSFANTYLGASSSAPTQDPDGSSLDLGDLYFSTSDNQLKVYGSGGWINAGSSVSGLLDLFKFTVSGTPTTLSGNDDNGNNLSFDASKISVFLNGVKLVNGTDVTVTSGNSLVFASALSNGDIVEAEAFGSFSVASLNASNLSSGTVPDARITGDYTGLTSLTITRADNSNALSLVSTDADANSAPILSMRRESGSPADNDLIGQLDFIGKDSGGVNTQYASIKGIIKDVTHNTEDGALEFVTFKSGFLNNALTLGNTETVFNDASVDVDFRVESNGNANMLFVDGGNDRVGIGTTSPSRALTVSGSTAPVIAIVDTGTSGTPSLFFGDSSADNVGKIQYSNSDNSLATVVNGSERMRIDSSGNFLVGTTSNNKNITGASLRQAGDGYFTRNDTPLYLNRLSSDGEILRFSKDGTVVGTIGSKSSNVFMSSISSNNTGFKINPDAITPSTSTGTDRDNAIDLGASSSRYKDIYLSGGAFIGGTGSANKLDDYEEGTWSPKLGNETTAVYNNQTGWYRKIGNTVFIYFSLYLSSKGDISGSYTKIANLPFNGSPSTQFGSGQIHAYRLGSSAHIQGIEFGGSVGNVGWIMTGGGSTTGYLNTSFVADNTYFEGFAMYRTA